MRAQFPAGVATLVRNAGRFKLYRRKLNQTALYMLTFDGVAIHCGKRHSVMKQFNRYAKAIGLSVITRNRMAHA